MRTLAFAAFCAAVIGAAGCTTMGGPGAKGPPRRLVQIEFQTLEVMDSALPAVGDPDFLTPAALRTLVEHGKASPTATLAVVTRDGQEAVVKGITEFIYPTEFSIPVKESQPVSVQVQLGGLVEPSGFEMREVGAILQVVPRITRRGQVELFLNPQTVEDPEWHSFGGQAPAEGGKGSDVLQYEQPFFSVHSLSARVVLNNGQPMVVAVCPRKGAPGKTVFVVVCGRIID